MLIKTKSIDTEIKEGYRRRAISRRDEDIRKGLTIANVPQRGDYGLCRDLDKSIKDFHKFKDPKDRAKIQSEYFGKQDEYKKNHVIGR